MLISCLSNLYCVLLLFDEVSELFVELTPVHLLPFFTFLELLLLIEKLEHSQVLVFVRLSKVVIDFLRFGVLKSALENGRVDLFIFVYFTFLLLQLRDFLGDFAAFHRATTTEMAQRYFTQSGQHFVLN